MYRKLMSIAVILIVASVLGISLAVFSGKILPAGGQLAYMAQVDAHWHIMIMDVERGLSDRLTSGASNNRYPAWSPDGNRITFHSDRDTNYYELYTMDPDGRNQVRLTDENMHTFGVGESPLYMLGNAMAAWSPDGQRIAFHSDVGGDWDLFLISPDGEQIERITSRQGDEVLFSWSPDGKKGIFSMDDPTASNTMHIYMMDLTNGEVEQLTFENSVMRSPETSLGESLPRPTPEPSPTPFPTLRPGLVATAMALNNQGLQLTPEPFNNRITPRTSPTTMPTSQISIVQDWHPEWSPDGREIVFAAERDTYSDDIFVYNIEQNTIRQLTEGPYNDHNPVWSADGEYVIFASDREGFQQIYLMNKNGENIRRLTDINVDSNAPAWKP